MSGVVVIRYLLKNAAAVTALVPANQIGAGVVKLGGPLPRLSLMTVSGVPRVTLRAVDPNRLYVERVQVTAVAKTYPVAKQILAAARLALPMTRGTVNGIDVDSLLPAEIGPDDEQVDVEMYEQSQDFIVKWRQGS